MFDLSSLSDRLSGIARAAMGALARLGPTGAASGPVLVAIHRCIERRLKRFRRLMARLAAGSGATRARVIKVATPHPFPPQEGEGKARPRATRRVSLVPRGYAWGVRMAQETASFGCQLTALLAEPGVAEMLERSPQAVAMLKPLCRMLAAELPAGVRPAQREKKPRRAPLRARAGGSPGFVDRPGHKVLEERWQASRLAAAKRLVRPPWRERRY